MREEALLLEITLLFFSPLTVLGLRLESALAVSSTYLLPYGRLGLLLLMLLGARYKEKMTDVITSDE